MANRIQLEAVLQLTDVQIDPRVFQKISRAVAGLPDNLNKTTTGLARADRGMRKLAGSTQKLKTNMDTNARAARLLLQRMTQFAILLPTFATLNRALQGSVKFMVDFEAEIKRIISLNIGDLSDKFDEIADAAFRIGREFRISALEAAQGIKLFTQAGFALEQAEQLAATAALAAKVSTLEVAEAQELAISVSKVFGKTTDELAASFDKIIKVEDLAAVGAQDIAQAFRTGGNALAFATKSFEDTVGLIAALREQTRKSGREVGTFFKTLSTRIAAAGESQTAVRNLGVEVTNLDGSLRPLAEVLNDIKTRFNGLTEAQQANIAKSIAGVRQFESFLGVIKSLDRAQELSAQSALAQGTAQEKQAIIATSLSEKLKELSTAGQGLARAISEAGVGEALVAAIEFSTVLIDKFSQLIQLADKFGLSVTPLLGLFGSVGVASVLGFGGGTRSLLGGRGFGGGGGGGGGASPAAVGLGDVALQSQNAKNALAALQQQTIKEVAGKKILVNTGLAQVSASKQFIGTARLVTLEQNRFAKALSNSTSAVVGFGKQALGRASTRVALLGSAALLAGAAVNSLGDTSKDATTNFSNSLTKLGGGAVQTGLLFGILNPAIGIAAAGLSVLSNAFIEGSKQAKLNADAFREAAARTQDRQGQEAFVETLGGFAGEIFVTEFQKFVSGRTRADVNQINAANSAFNALGSSSKALVGDAQKLLDVINDPTLFKKALPQIVQLDSALFKNQDAFAELQSAVDDNGNVTIRLSEAHQLLFKAMGAVEQAVDPVTGKLLDMVATFTDFQKRFATRELIQELQNMNVALMDASLPANEVAKGIDKLRIEATRAQTAFSVAEANFDDFVEGLKKLEGSKLFQGNFEDIDKIFEEAIGIARAPSGPESTAVLDAFLKRFPKDQAEFVKKFVQAEQKRFNAQVELAKANQAVQVEALSRTTKAAEAEKKAALDAQVALDNFNIALLEFGGNADAALANIEQFANLTDVEKAQRALANVSEAAAIRMSTLNMQIAELDAQIDALAGAADGSEDAFKRAGLEQQRSALALKAEEIERGKTLDTIKASIKLAEAQKKAADDAAKAEKERIKLLQELADASDELARSLSDAKREFAEFAADKVSDALDQQADAQQSLADAQQDVLENTQNLADAYFDLQVAILEVNGALAEAQIKTNLFDRDIGILTGSISTFQGRLGSLDSAFREVLDDANIMLEQRIQLERQLAEETLNFLQQARDEIVQAGLGVFGQSAQENQALQQGIAGLNFVAQQLGGSFENFLNMGSGDLAAVSQELLNLPLSLRQSILDALSFLPSTASIGGFSVEQLTEALGQVGAGVDAEVGLPSLEELTQQQVDQIQILQDLALKDAQLQFAQIKAAQDAVELAEEQLETSKILEERATEELQMVRDDLTEQLGVLEAANIERQELTNALIAADDINTVKAIESEANMFAEQNSLFRESFASLERVISSKLAQLGAAAAVAANANGFIPNFAGGNLTPGEAAGLLRAASREKRAMPGGAGLAVANTSEAIIPMRNAGFIPNFQDGNTSSISAGIEAVKGVNETVVAAIARSVTQALSDISTGGNEDTTDLLAEIAGIMTSVQGELSDLNDSNAAIQSNTTSTEDGGTGGTTAGAQDVNINLTTNQRQTVTVTGLETLRDEIRSAVAEAASEQVDAELTALLEQLDAVFTVLQERGLLSSLGQSG